VISNIVYLNELVHLHLRDDLYQGLQIWSNLFDQYLQAWDIKGCYQLLREIRRLDPSTEAGSIAYFLNKTAQGTLAAQTRNWETAIRVYEALLEITPEENFGWTLSNLGNVYYLSNEYNKALETYSRALDEYDKLSDSSGQARVLINLGSIYRDMGEIKKAIQSLERASQIIPDEDRETKAINLVNWASALQVSDDLVLAEEKYLQALQCLNQFHAPHLLAQVLGNIGTLYIATGNPTKALEYLLQDLTLHQQLDDLPGQGETLNNLGLAYSRMKEIDKALYFYTQSAQIRNDLGDVKGELTTWSNYLIAVINNSGPIPIEVLQKAKELAVKMDDIQTVNWLESFETG